MSIVSLLNVSVLNNPAKFTDPYQFEITFECLEQLKDDLEWKLTYVGSSTSLDHDQELDSLLVGPVPVGVNKFVFEADPPSPDLIPASELVSVTVIILSCSYAGNEFVRVGYYVNNEYDAPELNESPPSRVQVEHVMRNVLAEKPRVTRFTIPWDSDQPLNEYPPEQPEVDNDLDNEEQYGEEEFEEDEEEGEEMDDQQGQPQQQQQQQQQQEQPQDESSSAAQPTPASASVSNANDAEKDVEEDLAETEDLDEEAINTADAPQQQEQEEEQPDEQKDPAANTTAA